MLTPFRSRMVDATAADTPANKPFGIGKYAVHNLADELCLAGMKYGDAIEEAYDYFLRRAGGHFERIGEVFLPRLDDTTESYARAVCVRRDS